MREVHAVMDNDKRWDALHKIFAWRMQSKKGGVRAEAVFAVIVNILLVADGIRSGYLFDTLRLAEQEIDGLRALKLPHVLLIKAMEYSWDDFPQWFFVSSSLLRPRPGPDRKPLWVKLEKDDCHLLEQPSPAVSYKLEALQQLWSQPDFVVELKALREDLCPLAAFILEYPVAYIPIGDGAPEFGSSSLMLVEFILTVKTSIANPDKRHSLLKFSYPSQLDAGLMEERIQRTEQTMRDRLGRLPSLWSSLEVSIQQVSSAGVVL